MIQIQGDTISAIATAFGEAGIGIIRMSGKQAIDIADRIFKSVNGKKLTEVKDRSIILGRIMDSKGAVIDEVVVLIMRSPKSYTKEDIVEIQCHGGLMVTQKVLSRTLEEGARLAERGEFTKRAFLNGRLDLSQAQAVLDIIQAKTNEALKTAEDKLSGKMTGEIYKLKQQILKIIAHIEAIIDFPEDDIENLTLNEITNEVTTAIDEVNELLDFETKSKILTAGIEVAIIGKPNVGKSSLLNLLSKSEKAIVTDIPGTTRDVIEEYINIQGVPIKILDTAGIHKSTDKIEEIGIKKTKEKIMQANLVLALFDGSREFDNEDETIINLIKNHNVIVLLTKCDLPTKIDSNKIEIHFPTEKAISISVKTKDGVDILRQNITDKIKNMSGDLAFIRNARELEALRHVRKNLEEAKDTIALNIGVDFISIDLRSALQELNTLTGESVDEDIINEIFSKFCIGK